MGRWLSRVVSGIMRTFCFADRLSDDFPRAYSASPLRSSLIIHVLSSPFGGRDMPQPGSSQHGRVAVLETADHMRSTADLTYDPLQYVIGLPPYPIFRKKKQYGFSSLPLKPILLSGDSATAPYRNGRGWLAVLKRPQHMRPLENGWKNVSRQ